MTDFYLIWDHGLQYKDQIIGMIKECFPIVEEKFIDLKTISNLQKFIDKLYSLDTQNKLHIKAKTAHLFKFNPQVYIIFVDSKNNDEINKLKWKIREKYNPRFPNPKYQPHKALPPGITHDHVIHSSDNTKETIMIRDYIKKLSFTP